MTKKATDSDFIEYVKMAMRGHCAWLGLRGLPKGKTGLKNRGIAPKWGLGPRARLIGSG